MSDQSNQQKLEKLLYQGRKYHFEKGQVIQATDHRESLTLIEKGYVKRYLITNDGNMSIQVIYGPKDIFPLTLIFKELLKTSLYEGEEVFYYETMSACNVFSLESKVIFEAIKKDPELYKELLSVAGLRLRSNIQRLENLALKTFYNRLAHQLAFYAQEYGKKKKTGYEIQLPLTHTDLANILSASRETVSHNIAELRRNKVIKTGKRLLVPDIQKLQTEAYKQTASSQN